MQNVDIKLSDKFIETSADFASFSPVSSSDDKMIYIHFLKNKSIPVIVSQNEIEDEPGKANLQIGSRNELSQECTVLMGIEQLRVLSENLKSLLTQLDAQQSKGTPR